MIKSPLHCSLLENRTLLQNQGETCSINQDYQGIEHIDSQTSECAFQSQITIEGPSEDSAMASTGIVNRLAAPTLAFGLGLLRAVPESALTLIPTSIAAVLPFAIEKLFTYGNTAATKDSGKSHLIKNLALSLPAIVTGFVVYPLAHDTIEAFADEGPCEDPAFCGGQLEAAIEGYTQGLDNWALGLYNQVKPANGTLLPITDPLAVYDNTHAAASIIYNAFFGSLVGQHVGQKHIKFSSPHMEFPIVKSQPNPAEEKAQ